MSSKQTGSNNSPGDENELFEAFLRDMNDDQVWQPEDASGPVNQSFTDVLFAPPPDTSAIAYPMVFNPETVGAEGLVGPGGQSGPSNVKATAKGKIRPDNHSRKTTATTSMSEPAMRKPTVKTGESVTQSKVDGTGGSMKRSPKQEVDDQLLNMGVSQLFQLPNAAGDTQGNDSGNVAKQNRKTPILPKATRKRRTKKEAATTTKPGEGKSNISSGDDLSSFPMSPRLQRRRELNRENARKSRERKKMKMDHLLERAKFLEEQNKALIEGAIKQRESAGSHESDQKDEVPMMVTVAGKSHRRHLWTEATVLLDPSKEGFPITHVAQHVLDATGWTLEEVINEPLTSFCEQQSSINEDNKLTNLFQHGSSAGVPISLRTKSGPPIKCILLSTPLLSTGQGSAPVVITLKLPQWKGSSSTSPSSKRFRMSEFSSDRSSDISST